ncbi:thiolase family protein [Archaeoglobus neptunius]|uniref:thiolase family protein n=1 Tax=Archaeoglobus neptunius TaxID=2798580 RepID=UPI0019270F94|nr:thiolase family protein [Archaeoglobus neptunius]
MRIGIVGIGFTEFGIHREPFYNVAFEAARKALEDAGIERGEVDSFILGGYDNLGVGRTISNMYTAPAAGAYLRHEIRVSDDALFALPLAYMRLRHRSDVTMLLAFGHSSETPIELVELQSLDPFFHRPLNLTLPAFFAMQSYAYRNRYGVDEEKLAEVVVRMRENGSKSSLAFLRSKVKVEDVLNSEIVSYPLRKLEMAEWCDGCVAFILAEETMAKRITDEIVWVDGVGWSVENYYFDREFHRLPSVNKSGEMAFRMAKKERSDVGALEICDLTADYHCMILEALGFVEEGKGWDYDGDVNSSGGALCTNAYGSTGAFLLANLAMRIRKGEIDCGLTQSMSGYAQKSCVAILEG